MHWTYLEHAVMDTAEFCSASMHDRGVWVTLIKFCGSKENGGTIKGCKNWDDRTWLQLTGMVAKDLAPIVQLWAWDGDDLIVYGYPIEKEAKVVSNRKNGSLGGRPKKHAGTKLKPCGLPSENQDVTKGETKLELELKLELENKEPCDDQDLFLETKPPTTPTYPDINDPKPVVPRDFTPLEKIKASPARVYRDDWGSWELLAERFGIGVVLKSINGLHSKGEIPYLSAVSVDCQNVQTPASEKKTYVVPIVPPRPFEVVERERRAKEAAGR
jgi:hypothetical protein